MTILEGLRSAMKFLQKVKIKKIKIQNCRYLHMNKFYKHESIVAIYS